MAPVTPGESRFTVSAVSTGAAAGAVETAGAVTGDRSAKETRTVDLATGAAAAAVAADDMLVESLCPATPYPSGFQ